MSLTISVIVPVHNKGPHVARAIQSILNQTVQVEEIIVVDDASTDDSVAIIETFSDLRIKFLKRDKPGPGGYAARNLAIREAKSDWVAFLDADDEWRPDFIEEIHKLVETGAPDIICAFTAWERLWPDGRRQQDRYSAAYAQGSDVTTLDFDAFIDRWTKLGTPPIWTSACAFKRESLIVAGLFPEDRCRRGGDKDTWLRAMALGRAASSARVCAIYHQETANQVTKLAGTNQRHCVCHSIEHMIQGAQQDRRRDLRRLMNVEVFNYARLVALEQKIPRKAYQGFAPTLNPVKYLALLLMTYCPLPLQRLAKSVLVRDRLGST